ncbi:MAG: sensor histidine kinase [Acidobacteria bacterium]|nr:sensor histidine kinase [Acidobacteriota bacterium]
MRKLSSQIFLAQTAILAVSLAVGFVLFATTARAHLDQESQARAAAIAQTFAQIPTVQDCLTRDGPGCASGVQRLAQDTARIAGASYVVVIDDHRIRHSHPDPALIGKAVSEPLVAADGRVHLGINSGSTGVSANARVPLRSSAGAIIGEVSVGIRESSVSAELLAQLPSYGVWFVVMLAIGALASLGVASRMKRRTFGLELDEIAHLLQEREATLHGIREGVIAVDPAGLLTVVNDEALRLLRLPPSAVGTSVRVGVPAGPIRELLGGTSVITDQILLTEDHSLVINRLPVRLAGRAHGVVLTLQDRTVLDGLARELDGARSLTESMRAQQHEFSNRLHAIAGLLELSRPQEALDYVNEIRGTSATLDQTLRTHIGAPQIVGLMLGKAAEANELGIELVVTPETSLDESTDRVQALTTILGNLIDNAFDALAGARAPRRVEVTVLDTSDAVTVTVCDTGPGIPPESRSNIFRNGFTTKRDPLSRHSGLGLSLVHRTVTKLGGTVRVEGGPGAVFVVVLPRASAPLTKALSR